MKKLSETKMLSQEMKSKRLMLCEEIIRNEDAITRNEIKKAYGMRNAKRYTQIKIFNNF